jgi:hypothetical protein
MVNYQIIYSPKFLPSPPDAVSGHPFHLAGQWLCLRHFDGFHPRLAYFLSHKFSQDDSFKVFFDAAHDETNDQ